MGLTQTQIDATTKTQHDAAHASEPQARLLAGPGTGKSASIEERVAWLIEQSVPASAIAVVSFTRASASELARRVVRHGMKRGLPSVSDVQVSTLHALALRILKKAGQLTQYPADPVVLDDWEIENIFDSELGRAAGVSSITRRTEIRRLYEAFWCTGNWAPPNYIPPRPAISDAELKTFSAFLRVRGQLYACVLPGELIRKCVDGSNSGVVDLGALLGVTHLIVDEFQDLNPCDLEFINILVKAGVSLFAAGDDDQSIYAFRHANPSGIQDFVTRYPSAGSYELRDCFRSTPEVLDAAYAVLSAFPDPKRLPKSVHSLYLKSDPPVAGIVHRWSFPGSRLEAQAIASSCVALKASGVKLSDIMILLSNAGGLSPIITEELQRVGVVYRDTRAIVLRDSEAGRFGFAALRLVNNPSDVVALRTIVGLRSGVGAGTCAELGDCIISNNLSYRSVLHDQLPSGVFSGRGLKALTAARADVATLSGFSPKETLHSRGEALANLVGGALGAKTCSEWRAATDRLPDGMLLSELLQYLRLPSEDARRELLIDVCARLDIPVPAADDGDAVQILTMHGAKGLAAEVVFIPGLEESFLPGPKRAPFPGLVLEAARLLFVSVTRARAACVLSLSRRRFVNGKQRAQSPSRFASHLGGPLLQRSNGLIQPEVGAVMHAIAMMKS